MVNAYKLLPMFKEVTQRKIGLLASISVLLVTLFVTPHSTLDPINVPKLWVLLALAFAVLGVLLLDLKPIFNKENWPPLFAAKSVWIFMFIAMLLSDAPLSQQLFGTYGRNTGLFTYLAFVILFIGVASATGDSIQKPFLIAFGIAIGVNAIYGTFQALDKDPFNWSNPYAPVIGTLGNPNFVSAFLGMGVALALAYSFVKSIDIKYRILCLLYIAVALYDILKSDAQQGLIVSLLSAGLIGYFLIKSKIKNSIVRYSYLVIGFFASLIGVAGTLQKGPLASILYKPSVTYRGDYWHAGLEMFKNNLFFGVGLDSYGDWYRASRTVEATLRRGPSTVSNAAHNVYIDIAATAGIFALIAYLTVIFLGLQAAYRISKRATSFDPFFVAIFVAWVGYLVQSAISINNIALGIWGWVLPGILISKEKWQSKISKVDPANKNQNKMRVKRATDFSGMGLIAGLILGGTIGFLPFNSDANFRHSVELGIPEKIQTAALNWPASVSQINFATQLFDENKLQKEAVKLARKSIELNPLNFDGWNYLYNSPLVSVNEKREILDQLLFIDPHNPDLKKLG
jgi:O-antigen ligase